MERSIDPNPPEMSIRWHESPESVHRAMWEPVAIAEGMAYDELLAEGALCGLDESGNEVEMESGADIDGMRSQGCWAFVDTTNNCIHAWAAPDTDRGLVLHMLAHEIGHATGTPHPDGFQEEMRAEQFGRVAAAAYSMLLDKDRPQCTAPACGCADAYCMAWPDEAAPIAQPYPNRVAPHIDQFAEGVFVWYDEAALPGGAEPTLQAAQQAMAAYGEHLNGPDNGGVCQTCGGDLVGDGYSTVRHCENLDVIGEGYEPDAGPLHCQEPTNG